MKRIFNFDQLIKYRIPFSRWLNTFAFIFSLLFIVATLLDFAFILNPEEQKEIYFVYRVSWIILLLEQTFHLLFKVKIKSKRGINQRLLTAVILYSTLVPIIFHVSKHSFLNTFLQIIENKYYFTFAILVAAIGNISRGVVKLFNKKTNPALLMAASFAFIILIGAFLLFSPRCSTTPISITDALFVATSAVCVTGLTPLDISKAFTHDGQIIIMLLIQIGGLGVMTLTSFFAVFFMGNVGLSNQITVREMISTGTIQSLFSTLLHILGFTLIIELIGVVSIFFSIHHTLGMSLQQEVFFSIFHAISAFCNAGFSTLEGNLGNPSIIYGHNSFLYIISFLIILGGIGFPILVNLKRLLAHQLHNLFLSRIIRIKSFKRYSHIININTKIVLITTFILLLGGTLSLLFFEWNGAFAKMSIVDKIAQAFFNSASTRTAGFSTINLTLFSIQSLLIYTFLMWIGGAAQSTAGGIKVNTFAVAFLSLKSILRAENKVEVFKREISQISISRAYGTIFISIMLISIAIFIISLLEPDIPLFHLVFECFSAIGTVGSSLDTTTLLGTPAKILIIFLMFVGRIGLFTLIMSFIPRKTNRNYKFPKEHIIIN